MNDFVKMHGLGNDYIFFDIIKNSVAYDYSELSRRLSDRHFGVGGDGVVFIAGSDCAHARMIMYNSDGSRGRMCGNAIRCVAKYLHDSGIAGDDLVNIETDSGIKSVKVEKISDDNGQYRVDMGRITHAPSAIPIVSDIPVIKKTIDFSGKELQITVISVGNPHCVVLADKFDEQDFYSIAPKLSEHSMFPDGVNVEFIKINNRRSISMRVWERGTGFTLACGTGACAAGYVAHAQYDCDNNIKVHLPGGVLRIEVDGQRVFMTGGANEVYRGRINIKEFMNE